MTLPLTATAPLPEPATPRAPRVLHVITHLQLGGAERIALDLATQLRPEFETAVFVAHVAGRDAFGDALRAVLAEQAIPLGTGSRFDIKRGGLPVAAWRLARFIRTWRPDLIHLHTEIPEVTCAVALALVGGRGRPALLRTIHNTFFWHSWPRFGRWCDRRLAAGAVACVSEAVRTGFLRYRRGSGVVAPDQPLDVVYNGVSWPVLPPHARPHQAGVRRVLFAGRFEYQKGTDLLREALALVTLPANTRGELVLVGRGRHEWLLRTLAEQPPAGWTVEIRAPVPTIDPLLAQADVVVQPSRFEGLGLVAIEATLAGLPVVATDAPGLREALPADYPWRARHENIASLAATLSAALAETSRWGGVVSAAQQFARDRFDPAAMRRRYVSLYRNALG